MTKFQDVKMVIVLTYELFGSTILRLHDVQLSEDIVVLAIRVPLHLNFRYNQSQSSRKSFERMSSKSFERTSSEH